MAPRTKSKQPPAKRKQDETDEDTDVEIVTPSTKPAKQTRTSNTASEPMVSLLLSASTTLAVQAQPASNIALKSPKSHAAESSNRQEHSSGPYTKRAPVEEFWSTYGDPHSVTALTMAAIKDEYKISLRYFVLRLNLIVCGISTDEAEHLFGSLEASFKRRPGADDIKTRCFSSFLREAEYVNKLTHAWVEFYAFKWALSPAAVKYKSALNAAKMSRDLNWAKTPSPPSQPADCLSYLNEDGIEFNSKELLYFWRPFLAAIRCSPLEKFASQAGWIDGDDLSWLSALHVVCLTLIVRVGAAIVRPTTGTVGVSEIRWQLRMVMTFPLPILVNLKDGLWLAIIEEGLSDKGPLADLESDTGSSTAPSSYGGEEVETMLGFVDEDGLVCTAWARIQKEATEAENAQSPRLKHSLAVALQLLGPFFLGRHDFESIKAPVIAPGAELELGCLYRAGSRMERKALELYQDCVEEARLDALAMEIVQQKKKTAARRIRSEQNLEKEKEAVETLAAMIRQTREDNAVAIKNEKKLKGDKQSKGGILSRALSTLSKPSVPLLASVSSSFSADQAGNGTIQVPPSPQDSSPAALPLSLSAPHQPPHDSSPICPLKSNNTQENLGDAQDQIEHLQLQWG